MRVLIIDDSEYKYKQIKESLDRVCSPWISWEKSRNSGLVSVMKHNIKKDFEPYDMVIVDNIMPLYDGERNLEPYASDIVNEIRRLGLEDLTIVVCSADEIDECDYNYKIKYDSSVSLDETFKNIFSDLAAYQVIQEQIKDCRTCQNMSCRVENSEKPVEDCFGYINHEKKEQGLVKKLISNNKK